MNTQHSQRLTQLLRANSMTEDTLDLGTMTQLFLAQMRLSLYGGKSAIPMLPSFLKPFGTLAEGEPVAVAELDDREVRVSLVTISGGKAALSDADSFPIPGREYPAPLNDVIYAAAELLSPLLNRATRLALCLPFPVDWDGRGDACIRRFPGSMQVSDYEHIPVLASLARELTNRNGSVPPMVLVSEPNAALLAASLEQPGQSRYLGLTWGSDVDMGFSAPGSIVLRQPGISGELMLFTGGFSAAEWVPFGPVDSTKDRDSYGPGLDLYRKMVSTEYLGDTFRLMMIKAAENKLLSFGCSRDILSMTYLDLETLLDFLQAPTTGGTLAHFCREPEDRAVGLAVAHAVLDRAVRLVCANLSAVLQFTGAGRDAASPACLGIWGSALDSSALRTRLETYLHTFTQNVLGLHVSLCQGESMLTVGSAMAALYNC